MTPYPKRLIEVDLPIQRISKHARREKSIRHGHISTLHLWWARRPLAACRAVLCAALWPDPAGEHCPHQFRERAVEILTGFARQVTEDRTLAESCADSFPRWLQVADGEMPLGASDQGEPLRLRGLLLDFIAEFANWDNASRPLYLETSRALTDAAHQALGGVQGSRPLVVDPFAGGGSIPLEALRIGADAFASDLNPVAVLLNKVVLEYIPRYGQRLADEVRKWGEWVKEQAEKELAQLYPTRPVGRPHDPPVPQKGWWYACVWRCADGIFHIEHVENPARRWREHREGAVPETAERGPVELWYYDLFANEREAMDRASFWNRDEGAEPLAQRLAEIGETPIAYLWARTITCEGPGCGAEVPLIRSLWLAKRGSQSVALRLIPRPEAKRVEFDILVRALVDGKPAWVRQSDPETVVEDARFDGTVRRGAATCPCCGFTTPVVSVRRQLKERRGGTADARMFAVVTSCPDEARRSFRLPLELDAAAVRVAVAELERRKQAYAGGLSLIPDEPISSNELRRISVPLYGIGTWGDLFSPRQVLVMATLTGLASRARAGDEHANEPGLATAAKTVLGLSVSRLGDICNANCRWENTKPQVRNLFTRQAIGMVWDFAEPNPLADAAGTHGVTLATMLTVVNGLGGVATPGQASLASATRHPLPDDAASAIFTDPPYYDAVPYAYLSDFFYVWLRRTLAGVHPALFRTAQVPKDGEIVVDRPHELSNSCKDVAFYERELTTAFGEARRVLRPEGVATVVFASKTTASWEAVLQAVVGAGWIITASWPVDTELENRIAAQGQARLASSVHLVCRPRENPDGSLRTDSVGEWRHVLAELPVRIREWMPRLAEEGVVGADAIFACLGPALEIYSRYSVVEKTCGDAVTLREYLEHVWAVVAREALTLVLEGADATGFEEDARLTVIWFWVLKASTGGNGNGARSDDEDGHDDDADDEPTEAVAKGAGFAMEYDAARKLAQGLGADLEKLSQPGGILTIHGGTAAMLEVASREGSLVGAQLSLFGESTPPALHGRSRSATAKMKPPQQRELPLGITPAAAPAPDPLQPTLPGMALPRDDRPVMERILASGTTTLDRLHQAMLLFGRGHTALLGQFLEYCNMATEERFWRLAQALSVLYPANTEEKRWVDGLLARKKGLGV